MRKTLKRGARGSTEDEESNSKRLNMAATKTTEAMVAGSDDEARGGGNSHMKVTGMLVVSLRGVNCKFWSRLGFPGRKANIFTHTGIA